VPEGGVVDGGSGEEIFAGLLDSHLAAQVPAQWNDGLSDALVRQLRGRMQEDAGAAAPSTATPHRAETVR
jgi:Rod binding domain-containing protein